MAREKTTNKPAKSATDKAPPQSRPANIIKASPPWHHELIVPDAIIVHDPSSRIPSEQYLYWNPDLGEPEVRRILKQGFFPVAPLIIEMQKSDDWDAALPSVWELLCCEAIPGMPQKINMREWNRFFVLNKVFKAAMGDLGIDYQHYRRLGPPPLLAPYRLSGGEWVKAERGRGQEYYECWINIEQFKFWVKSVSELIAMTLPMPEILRDKSETPEAPVSNTAGPFLDASQPKGVATKFMGIKRSKWTEQRKAFQSFISDNRKTAKRTRNNSELIQLAKKKHPAMYGKIPGKTMQKWFEPS